MSRHFYKPFHESNGFPTSSPNSVKVSLVTYDDFKAAILNELDSKIRRSRYEPVFGKQAEKPVADSIKKSNC